jgi:hypothetical protein
VLEGHVWKRLSEDVGALFFATSLTILIVLCARASLCDEARCMSEASDDISCFPSVSAPFLLFLRF